MLIWGLFLKFKVFIVIYVFWISRKHIGDQTKINIREVIMIHDSLCDATSYLGVFFSHQMALLFFNMVLFNLMCFFEIAHNLKSEVLTTLEVTFNIYDTTWLIYDSYFLVSVFVVTSILNDKALEARTIFNKIENGGMERKKLLTVSKTFLISYHLLVALCHFRFKTFPCK